MVAKQGKGFINTRNNEVTKVNFTFTEEQQRLQKVVKEFALNEVAPKIPEMESAIFPRDILTKLASLRLLGIPIPKKYGGAGLDFTSYIVAINELSKVSATVGVILSVHTSVGTKPILHFGTEQQKEKYVSKLASGEFLGAFCLTEPNAGSDAANIQTRYEKSGENYIINGSKIFITNGGEADLYIVYARRFGTSGNNGISAFIVEKDFPGLIIGKDERKMGLHGSKTVQLTFENLRVPAENLLGKEGDGLRNALANLSGGRIGIAAQALGIAEAAFRASTQYATENYKFGKRLIDNQAIAFKLANMATEIEATRLLVYQAADLQTRRINCRKEAAMAKLFASKTAVQVTTEAVQIFGNNGYSKAFPVERYFRDAKVTEIYEGTSEIQKIVIANSLL